MSNFEPSATSPAAVPPTVPPPSTIPPPSSGDAGSGGVKEQGKQVAGAAAEQGKEVAGTAAQQGKEVASTAAAGAQQVAEEAAREIKDVARTAADELHGLVGQVSGELRGQASSQTDRLAGGMRTLSAQLQRAASGEPLEAGPVRDLARQASTTLEQLSSRLSEGGLEGLGQDVSAFARRRPGLFLAGAAGAGFFVGRMLRGAQAASNDGGGTAGATTGSFASSSTGRYGAAAQLPPTSTSAPHLAPPAVDVVRPTDVVVIDDGDPTGLPPGTVPSNPVGGPR